MHNRHTVQEQHAMHTYTCINLCTRTHTYMHTHHQQKSKISPTKQDPSEPSLQLQARVREGRREGSREEMNTPPTSYSDEQGPHCFRNFMSAFFLYLSGCTSVEEVRLRKFVSDLGH